ncbi:MAG: porin family protein [Deltaproteobacteria bacterium]|nr:porin family protein [Deltaproteobacteria bacterium]
MQTHNTLGWTLRPFRRLCWGVIALGLLMLAPGARADDLYLGLGLGGKAGEPDFTEKIPTLTLAYEHKSSWRFSLTSGDYEHSSKKVDLETRIFGVERMWVNDLGKNMLLIGAFGPGLFQATLKSGGNSESGTKFGILASANLRFYLGKGFLDLGYHYRNAAVIINRSSVNGGYEALALGFGLRF